MYDMLLDTDLFKQNNMQIYDITLFIMFVIYSL